MLCGSEDSIYEIDVYVIFSKKLEDVRTGEAQLPP